MACLRPHWAGISNPGTSSSFAVFEEERSVVKSPTISTVHRRTTGAQERWRRNPASANNKGKEPVAATASCPPLGKSARTHSRWDYFTCLIAWFQYMSSALVYVQFSLISVGVSRCEAVQLIVIGNLSQLIVIGNLLA